MASRHTSKLNKRLVVLRHASSGPAVGGAGDHARSLDSSGVRSVPVVGARLAQLGWKPQMVMSSNATRTKQTWMEMAESLGGEVTPEFRPELYLAEPSQIVTALAVVPAEVETVMIIGHNPGLEELLDELCRVRVRMVPCTAALLEIDADDWASASVRADWHLDTVLRPDAL